MILTCHQPFGNFKPGDDVEVPDGAGFDPAYFEVKKQSKAPVKAARPVEKEDH